MSTRSHVPPHFRYISRKLALVDWNVKDARLFSVFKGFGEAKTYIIGCFMQLCQVVHLTNKLYSNYSQSKINWPLKNTSHWHTVSIWFSIRETETVLLQFYPKEDKRQNIRNTYPFNVSQQPSNFLRTIGTWVTFLLISRHLTRWRIKLTSMVRVAMMIPDVRRCRMPGLHFPVGVSTISKMIGPWLLRRGSLLARQPGHGSHHFLYLSVAEHEN